MIQLSLFDWPLERMRRVSRGAPRVYWRRLRDAVTARLLDEIGVGRAQR